MFAFVYFSQFALGAALFALFSTFFQQVQKTIYLQNLCANYRIGKQMFENSDKGESNMSNTLFRLLVF